MVVGVVRRVFRHGCEGVEELLDDSDRSSFEGWLLGSVAGNETCVAPCPDR